MCPEGTATARSRFRRRADHRRSDHLCQQAADRISSPHRAAANQLRSATTAARLPGWSLHPPCSGRSNLVTAASQDYTGRHRTGLSSRSGQPTGLAPCRNEENSPISRRGFVPCIRIGPGIDLGALPSPRPAPSASGISLQPLFDLSNSLLRDSCGGHAHPDRHSSWRLASQRRSLELELRA